MGGLGMNFEDYQDAIQRTMPDTGRRDRLAMLALGVAGEAGEVADTIKKHLFQGHDLDPAEVAKEIGDVLWYLGNLCTAIGWDMGVVAGHNVEKLRNRYPNGFEAGRSRVRLVEDGGLIGGIVYNNGQNATAQDVADRLEARDLYCTKAGQWVNKLAAEAIHPGAVWLETSVYGETFSRYVLGVQPWGEDGSI